MEHAQTNGISNDTILVAVLQTLVGTIAGASEQRFRQRLIDYDGRAAKGLREMVDGRLGDVARYGLDAAHRAVCAPRE